MIALVIIGIIIIFIVSTSGGNVVETINTGTSTGTNVPLPVSNTSQPAATSPDLLVKPAITLNGIFPVSTSYHISGW